MIATAFTLVFAAVTGLVLGSYAVTAAIRYARGEGSVRGVSHCDACGARLGFAQTLPLVSYVGLRGACGGCGTRIDPTHPVGEALGATILLGAALVAEPWRAVPLAGLGLLLLALAVVDLRLLRLPDHFTGGVAACALILAAAAGPAALLRGGLAALVTVAVLLGLRAIQARRGDPGLGLGDVKLLGALALWLGPATPLAVLAACGLGLAAAPWLRDTAGRMPFGPMIALGGWAVGLAVEAGWSPWTR